MKLISKTSAKELLSDAFPIIEKFAPGIAGAIGGPIGFAAGYIIPVLARAFGSPSTDLKQLVANILNDPHAADKLGEIEHEHSDWLCSITDSVDRLTSAEVNIKLSWAEPK
jgi:hypothetical protein